MATKWINVKGKITWPKLFDPDNFRGQEFWVVNFYPENDEELKKITDAEVMSKQNVDKETGEVFYRFRRPTTKTYSDGEVQFTPPKITGELDVKYVNEDQEEVGSVKKGVSSFKRVGTPITIGNGTEVILNLCVYNTSMGNGTRLETVNITKLIEYKRDDQKDQVENKSKDNEDDELPF